MRGYRRTWLEADGAEFVGFKRAMIYGANEILSFDGLGLELEVVFDELKGMIIGHVMKSFIYHTLSNPECIVPARPDMRSVRKLCSAAQ